MHDDPTLVARSRDGDTEAFGLLVERHQGAVCGVAYSALGDVGRSEEIAQETFLAAWRSLSTLRDPNRLRGWLCGIARNQIRGSIRKKSRDVIAGSEPLAAHGAASSAEPGPDEQAAAAEEAALLWRTLQRLEPKYREPMVLYYRSGESIREVAESLELSEGAVKTRLHRGREMLAEQMTSVVERTLQRTGPGKALTVAIMAALPAIVTKSAAGAGAGATGAAAAKASIGLGAIAGPLLGIAGSIFGSWMSIRNTRSPRERQFMIKANVYVYAYVLGYLLLFGAAVLSVIALDAGFGLGTAIIAPVIVLYVVGLVVGILRLNRKQRQIQREEGTYVDPKTVRRQPTSAPSMGSAQISLAGAIVGLIGATFGSLCWIPITAAVKGDTTAAIVAGGGAIVVLVLVVCAAASWPSRIWRITAATIVIIGAIDAIVLNACWVRWDLAKDAPIGGRWTINLGLAAFVVFMAGLMLWLEKLVDRRKRQAH